MDKVQTPTPDLDRAMERVHHPSVEGVNHAAFAPLFFLWNDPRAGRVMVGYAPAENLPIIAVQRYNRFRLRRTVGSRTTRPLIADFFLEFRIHFDRLCSSFLLKTKKAAYMLKNALFDKRINANLSVLK